MNEKPKVVYHGSQYLFEVLMPRQANGQCELYGTEPEHFFPMLESETPDKYVCKIASMEEVNEKWDTLVSEHLDDPNWAVWKKEIIAEISAGREIPYYGILDGEIIC